MLPLHSCLTTFLPIFLERFFLLSSSLPAAGFMQTCLFRPSCHCDVFFLSAIFFLYWLSLIPKFIVDLLERGPALSPHPSAVIRIPMIVSVQVCQVLLFLTFVQAISRRVLLCVSSQCFGVNSKFPVPENCTYEPAGLPKRHTLQMLQNLLFSSCHPPSVPYLCCSLSTTLNLTLILSF